MHAVVYHWFDHLLDRLTAVSNLQLLSMITTCANKPCMRHTMLHDSTIARPERTGFSKEVG